jgi:hypothetical protein
LAPEKEKAMISASIMAFYPGFMQERQLLLDPEFLQYPHHRAPVGECRLQQVKPHKSGKPQPQRADKIN